MTATLVVVVAMLAAACGGGNGVTSTVSPTPEAAATPTFADFASPTLATTGCTPARPHEPGSLTATLPSGGIEREYMLYVPPSYGGDEATPLVVNLHGFGSNAAQQAIYSGLPLKAEDEGFIVATPQGTGAQPHWNFTTVEAGAPDDVAFVSDLLDRLESDLCIDSARVYATGISNGAAMSVTLACYLSDRIAAIAPVAGVFFFPGCPATRPVPVIAFHGTDDMLVPFEGGPVGDAGLQAPPVEESVDSWAQHNGCAPVADDLQVSEHVRQRRYTDCEKEASVELYAVEGGGHTWPGAAFDIPFGATTHEINATNLMWDFFKDHPKP